MVLLQNHESSLVVVKFSPHVGDGRSESRSAHGLGASHRLQENETQFVEPGDPRK